MKLNSKKCFYHQFATLVTKSATEGKDVSGKDLDLSKFER